MSQIHSVQSIQSVHSQRPHHYVPKFRGCIHSIPTTLYHIHSIHSQCPSPPCTNIHTMWVDDLFALSNLPMPPCTNIPSIHSQHSQHPQHPVPKFTASIQSIPTTFYQHSQHPHHPVPKLTVLLAFTTPIHSVPTPCTNINSVQSMGVDYLFALSTLPPPPCTTFTASIHSIHSAPHHPVLTFTAFTVWG